MLIVFDLMGTLLTDPYQQAHEAASGRTFAQFDRDRPPGVYHRLERGEIPEEAYWRSLREAGIAFNVELFHRVRREGYGWLPGMRELVVECAAAHRTVVGSNYPDWIAEVGRDFLADLGVEVFASHQFGVRKPEAAFFELLCERTGSSLRELVLIDDKQRNVEAVTALGGLGIHFVSARNTTERLRANGLLVTGMAER
ncbi:putative hydrolase of the HAD superfamily [Kitasatospora viridis]|uniref:Putative hydrolase of the HAD superfamily n=1 Tax=Kitasatospora viridis TaxID=281105 RepID=A0A561TSS1_9ACTN|nr:putative hydrolase of the HAD superfamily [Kitasatospora viridis]